MILACLDLEGVLLPEIWIAFADAAGIPELRRTTRDEPDYDVLMRFRLDLLAERGLGMREIERVIDGLEPLEGARAFLDELRASCPVVILSDTFYGFARPLMAKLGQPTLFCHDLEVAPDGRIVDYRLRLADHKRHSVRAFRDLNFSVIAAGDSYNDTTMLGAADAGILFRPPDNVVREFPQFPVTRTYAELLDAFRAAERELGA